MQKAQPSEDIELNFHTDGGMIKQNNPLTKSNSEAKFTQELTYYIIPVMLIYNSSKFKKAFKYRVFCMTLLLITSHLIMIVMFKDLFQKGGQSLDFSKSVFGLITRKQKDRRLYDIPSAQEIQTMDIPFQNEYLQNIKNEFIKKFERAENVNNVKRILFEIAGNNSNFIHSTYFETFTNEMVNKIEHAKKLKKVKQIVSKLKLTQLMKKLDFLSKTRRLEGTNCSEYMDPATLEITDQTAYENCMNSLFSTLLSNDTALDCSRYVSNPDPIVYEECLSLSVGHGDVNLSTLNYSTIDHLDFSVISDTDLGSYFSSHPDNLIELDYDHLAELDYDELNLSTTQIESLFANDASIPYGTNLSEPGKLKYYLTTEPFNLSNQSQVAQMGSINAQQIIQSNPNTVDQTKGKVNQQVILAIVKVCGIFMAFYMSVKKSAEGNHTHLFFYILEKKTSKSQRLGNFFGYYEIVLGFLLYLTTFFVIVIVYYCLINFIDYIIKKLGETNSIELIKDIAGLCILTDLDEWMCTYLRRNKEFMKEFEISYLTEQYGYDDGNFVQEITTAEEERYYQDHKKSINSIAFRLFQILNDLMTMAMGAIVIVASQTAWRR